MSKTEITLTTRSPEATLALGEALGQRCGPGFVVTLQGTLGAGKTLLTKGLAKGLGVDRWEYVNSPTYTLMASYSGAELELHHADLYRLGGEDEAVDAGLEELMASGGVTAVEWPERAEGLFAAYAGYHIAIESLGETERFLRVASRNLPQSKALEALEELAEHHPEAGR